MLITNIIYNSMKYYYKYSNFQVKHTLARTIIYCIILVKLYIYNRLLHTQYSTKIFFLNSFWSKIQCWSRILYTILCNVTTNTQIFRSNTLLLYNTTKTIHFPHTYNTSKTRFYKKMILPFTIVALQPKCFVY